MRISDTIQKAENLKEQGEIAKQRQIHFQQAANSARAQMMAAYARLEAASETDEEGNPVGDVAGAQAEVYAAQALLESAENGLAETEQQIEAIGQRKMETVRDIEHYESVEEGNLSKLAELQKKRFGINANAFLADLAARMNSGEQARIQLLQSMGISAQAKTYSAGGVSGGFSSPSSAGSNSAKNLGEHSLLSSIPFLRKDIGKTEHKPRSIDFNGWSLAKNGVRDDQYFVQGNHFEQYCEMMKNINDYTQEDVNYSRTINPRDIENIYLNDNEVLDPNLFWNRGQTYEQDSQEYFLEVASHIPEVRERLNSGESIESICSDEKMEACYNLYFAKPVEVYEIDDYYQFAGSGRHRIMAAQKLGYEIPVTVKGRIVKKGSPRLANMSTYKRISGNHSIEDDLLKTNPKYSKTNFDSPYNNNCQRCVSAYEARRRGYDVEALPLPDGYDTLPIMMDPNGWPSVYQKAELINCSGNSGTAAGINVEEKLKSWGNNCRAIVRVRWKPECGGGGHVFIAERTNGITRFVDPQNNNTNAKDYFEDAKGSDVYCVRIDHLPFTETISKCCKNK